MFLNRLITALNLFKVDYALVGGYAVALHGVVRGTVDIDLVIGLSESQYLQAEKAFLKLGLESRLPVDAQKVFQFRKEYIENRNLVAWSFYNPRNPIEVVDVIITHDRFKMKTVSIKVPGGSYQVAAISELIQMKTQSGRAQDLADIEALVKIKDAEVPGKRKKKT